MTDLSPELRHYAEMMIAMQGAERRQRQEWDDLDIPVTDFCLANWHAEKFDAYEMYAWHERGARTALEYELAVENAELAAETERLRGRVESEIASRLASHAALMDERDRPAKSKVRKVREKIGKRLNRVTFHVSCRARDAHELYAEMINRFYREGQTFQLTHARVAENGAVNVVMVYTVKGGHPADVEKRLDRMEKVTGPITDRSIEVVSREVL